MAEIGCLGDVIFTVSYDQILTPGNGTGWNSSAKITEHDRHNYHPALEHTGTDADQMSLPIHLSRYRGVDPMEMIWKLFDYERDGKLLPLTIGNHAYGMYRWLIKSTRRTLSRFDGKGDLIEADVTLELVGYTK